MLWQLFSAQSVYKKRAKFAAIVWTLLIFMACFIPSNEIPNLKIPFIDKWVHFVLFGGFSFLWMFAYPSSQFIRLVLIFLLGAILGWLVEELQGLLSFLGRAKDLYDIYADVLGSFLGVSLFLILSLLAKKKV